MESLHLCVGKAFKNDILIGLFSHKTTRLDCKSQMDQSGLIHSEKLNHGDEGCYPVAFHPPEIKHGLLANGP